jgi:phosphoribosyl 1,2-cyclic phosphate phosphodiesterase
VQLHEVDEPFAVESRYDDDTSVRVEPIRLLHGDMPVYGYRIGRLAYLTDVSEIPESSRAQLDNLDVLILDALRPEPHPTHYSFDEAVEVARDIGARKTYFIHMTHNVRHAAQERRLPDDIHLGYDGLTVEVE